jgi:hypothetical protein
MDPSKLLCRSPQVRITSSWHCFDEVAFISCSGILLCSWRLLRHLLSAYIKGWLPDLSPGLAVGDATNVLRFHRRCLWHRPALFRQNNPEEPLSHWAGVATHSPVVKRKSKASNLSFGHKFERMLDNPTLPEK